MAKNKPLDLEGAILKSGGYSGSPGNPEKYYWTVKLADGTIFQRNRYHPCTEEPGGEYTWQRWWPRPNRWEPYAGSLRVASRSDNSAVDKWAKAHPEFKADPA